MWSKTVTGLVASGLLLSTQAAFADPHGWHERGWRDHGYRNAGPEYDYARVVNVDPIVRQVRVSSPRQECWTETRYEQVDSAPNRGRGAAGSMILGGILGAAIGNQIGGGDGRRAATVAGALIGSAIGHDVAERRNGRYVDTGYREERPHDVQRCDVRYDENYEQHIDGYRVTYVYNGRQFTTRLPYDPGDQIRVRVDVQPHYDGRYYDDRHYDDDHEDCDD
jgi:uncharacterized protein YcfJ